MMIFNDPVPGMVFSGHVMANSCGPVGMYRGFSGQGFRVRCRISRNPLTGFMYDAHVSM